jgi:hypothetical protein
VDGPLSLRLKISVRADRPVGRQAKLEAGGIGTGDEEAVERADRQSVERGHHGDQQVAKKHSVGGGPFDGRRQFRGRSRRKGIGGCGKSVQHTREDFTGRLAGEGGSEDLSYIGAVGE